MISRILAVLVAGASLAGATDNNSFRWTGTLAPGQLIEVKGINGNIRAEPSNSGQVEVVADKTGYRYDPADVEIQMVENGNGVTVCAVYPSRDGRQNECRPGAAGRMNTNNNDVKVEFTVRVPNGVRFIGRTVNGGVQADRLGADVEAHTVNGKIILSTAGAALADSVNGSIHAIVGNPNWEGARKFSTVNGSIELDLPESTSTELSATTVNGHITTELPIAVHGHLASRSLHGTLHSGGRWLKISTVNGNIILRQIGGPTV